MKKIRILCLLLSLLLLLTPAAQAAEPTLRQGCHGVDAADCLSDSERLTDTAKAVILYERKSGTMLYTYQPDEKIYPASTVKLMTALVALEEGELSEEVLVTKRALNSLGIGGLGAGLVAGEELTLEQLLYCMMVASANDAAAVIAEHIGGTQDNFLRLMNAKAQALGCTGTNYSNVHGLHDEDTYTTARDICRLLDAALENETFRKMFCTETYTVPETKKAEARELWTGNYMMTSHGISKYRDSRVIGGRTGNTNEAGRCLVALSEGNGMELISIVMGAKATYEADGLSLKAFGSFEETKVLLDYAMDNYRYRQVYYPGQAVAQYPVSGGANSAVAGSVEGAATVLPKDLDESQLKWTYSQPGTLTAPLEKGTVLTTAQLWYGEKCLIQTELTALTDVKAQQSPEISTQPEAPQEEENGGKWIVIALCCLVGLGILVAAGLIGVRFLRRRAQEARRKRRRNNRQRSR